MAKAAAFMADMTDAHMSRQVMYHRGGDAVELRASVGRTAFEVDDGHGIVRFESRDYIVRADSLVLSAGATLPRRGDRIIEHDRDGDATVYEVVNVAGQPEWRPCDTSRRLIRIHTKLVTSPGQ